jgi:chromosome segregation ATPase
MADAYTKTPIYYKVCTGILVVGLCALIGAAVNLTFLFAATAVGLIGVCSFLFENHGASSKKKEERLKQDVSEMETSIKSEVETLGQIEGDLRGNLEAISSENLRLAQTNERLETTIEQLNTQVEQTALTVEDLKRAKDAVSQANKELLLKVSSLSTRMESFQKELELKTSAIPRLAKKLSSKNQVLIKTNQDLEEMSALYKEQFEKLKIVEASSREQLRKIEALRHSLQEKNRSYQKLEAQNDALLQSINRQIQRGTDSVNEALSKSDDVIAKAMAFLGTTSIPSP